MTGFPVIAGAVVVLAAITVLLRRRKLREKYTFLWLIVGTVTLVLALFPGILRWASELLGVQVPSNLLFAVAIVFLAGVCLHLSLEVTAVEDESRILAEELSILRAQFEQARQRGEPGKRGEPGRGLPGDGGQESGGRAGGNGEDPPG
ncbi:MULTISPECIES: DUF2304 domain-containing protein [unclassified Arthrobacter]|uniref:DUF2304 domain-containing protein n=1 Tax=unclassified Arthrobacter TaxID=235627 RepID=UPI0021075F76|nr:MULTISPECIES: DUF2304 domain-containing protein [unclassified Arthrobacter]MCQ1945377.1 DUF2304 domain-containing protein [Arthrobacter sp. zg-Y1116]MCQ1985323.1 DUF2304 domain-containing protein [Arthrobacter sp. zg-Y844]MCQ1994962.1 DUF2304 domain-containing protein [Arthrobacter sp. zg-Y1171]UWX80980.1 DUF2304 domain-containing protein [Arthrobacter sp. zg-Y1171]